MAFRSFQQAGISAADVLAEDLHTITPSKIKDVQIVRTMVDGNTVYQA